MDRVGERLQIAKTLGATHAINTADPNIDLVQEVKKLTGGKGSTLTIETTGVLPVIKSGIEFTARRGQLVLIGIPKIGAELSFPLLNFIGVRWTHMI